MTIENFDKLWEEKEVKVEIKVEEKIETKVDKNLNIVSMKRPMFECGIPYYREFSPGTTLFLYKVETIDQGYVSKDEFFCYTEFQALRVINNWNKDSDSLKYTLVCLEK